MPRSDSGNPDAIAIRNSINAHWRAAATIITSVVSVLVTLRIIYRINLRRVCGRPRVGTDPADYAERRSCRLVEGTRLLIAFGRSSQVIPSRDR